MDDLPSYIGLVFVITTLATISFVYFAVRATESKKSHLASSITIGIIALWMLITYWLADAGFYRLFSEKPPRLLFAIGPPILAIILLLLIKRTRGYLMRIPITILTYLHIIRIPIEMVLWWLAVHHAVPYLVTFEGINYDILSGVTAPFIAIFFVGVKRENRIGAVVWNLATLVLLLNVVIHALLSVPTPFQKFSFDQPMMAVLYTPFIWLPSVVVPIVFWSHLVALTQLIKSKSE